MPASKLKIPTLCVPSNCHVPAPCLFTVPEPDNEPVALKVSAFAMSKFKVPCVSNLIPDKSVPNCSFLLTVKAPLSKSIPLAKLLVPVISVKSTFAPLISFNCSVELDKPTPVLSVVMPLPVNL